MAKTKTKTRWIWTRTRLHRHLLKLLSRPTTTLEHHTFRDDTQAGDVVYDDEFPTDKLKIRITGNTTETLRHVVHELLHVVLYPYLHGQFDETLEEVQVVAFDHFIVDYINKKKSRLDRWNTLITAKLKESEGAHIPVPFEEQVQRGPNG